MHNILILYILFIVFTNHIKDMEELSLFTHDSIHGNTHKIANLYKNINIRVYMLQQNFYKL